MFDLSDHGGKFGGGYASKSRVPRDKYWPYYPIDLAAGLSEPYVYTIEEDQFNSKIAAEYNSSGPFVYSTIQHPPKTLIFTGHLDGTVVETGYTVPDSTNGSELFTRVTKDYVYFGYYANGSHYWRLFDNNAAYVTQFTASNYLWGVGYNETDTSIFFPNNEVLMLYYQTASPHIMRFILLRGTTVVKYLDVDFAGLAPAGESIYSYVSTAITADRIYLWQWYNHSMGKRLFIYNKDTMALIKHFLFADKGMGPGLMFSQVHDGKLFSLTNTGITISDSDFNTIYQQIARPHSDYDRMIFDGQQFILYSYYQQTRKPYVLAYDGTTYWLEELKDAHDPIFYSEKYPKVLGAYTKGDPSYGKSDTGPFRRINTATEPDIFIK